MKRGSDIYTQAIAYVTHHRDLIPVLGKFDRDVHYSCHRVLAEFRKEVDGRIYMDVIFVFTHLVDGMPLESSLTAGVYYNRSNGSYRLLEVEVRGLRV